MVFEERQNDCYGGGSRDHLLVDSEEPQPGAHVVTPRIGYLHHGIYLGAGKVIHSGAVSGLLPRGPVEEVSLEDFSRGRRVWVKSGIPARFTAQEVIDRARSRLGEDHYHLLKNNCEHLCEWCLRGRERSYQVDRVMRWLRPWRTRVSQMYSADHSRPSASRWSSTKVQACRVALTCLARSL